MRIKKQFFVLVLVSLALGTNAASSASELEAIKRDIEYGTTLRSISLAVKPGQGRNIAALCLGLAKHFNRADFENFLRVLDSSHASLRALVDSEVGEATAKATAASAGTVAALTAEKDALTARIRTLEEMLAKQTEAVANLEGLKAALQETRSQLEGVTKGRDTATAEATATKTELGNQMAALTALQAAFDQYKETQGEATQKLTAELETLRQASEARQREKVAVEVQVAGLQTELETLKAAQVATTATVTKLQDSLAAKEAEVTKVSGEKVTLDAQIASLTLAMATLEATHRQTDTSLTAARQDLETAQARIEEATAEKAALEATLATLKQTQAATDTEKAQQAAQIQTLTSTIAGLEAAVAKKTQELEAQAQVLRDAQAKAEEEKARQIAAITALQGVVDQKTEESRGLTQTITTQSTEIDSLKGKLALAQTNTESKDAEILNLQGQIAVLVAQLEKDKVAAADQDTVYLSRIQALEEDLTQSQQATAAEAAKILLLMASHEAALAAKDQTLEEAEAAAIAEKAAAIASLTATHATALSAAQEEATQAKAAAIAAEASHARMLAERDMEIAALKAESTAFQTTARDQEADRTARLAEAQRHIDELQGLSDRLKAANEDYQRKIEDMERELTTAQGNVSATEQALRALEDQEQQAKQDLEGQLIAMAEAQRLSQMDMQTQAAELGRMRDEADRLKAEKDDLEQKRSAVESLLQQTKTDAQEKASELEAVQQSFEAQAGALATLQQEKSQKEEQISKLQSDLAETKEKQDALESSIKVKENELKELQEKATLTDQERKRIGDLTSELENLKTERERLSAALDQKTKELASEAEKAKELEGHLASADQELSANRARLEVLERQKASHLDIIRQLTEEIKGFESLAAQAAAAIEEKDRALETATEAQKAQELFITAQKTELETLDSQRALLERQTQVQEKATTELMLTKEIAELEAAIAAAKIELMTARQSKSTYEDFFRNQESRHEEWQSEIEKSDKRSVTETSDESLMRNEDLRSTFLRLFEKSNKSAEYFRELLTLAVRTEAEKAQAITELQERLDRARAQKEALSDSMGAEEGDGTGAAAGGGSGSESSELERVKRELAAAKARVASVEHDLARANVERASLREVLEERDRQIQGNAANMAQMALDGKVSSPRNQPRRVSLSTDSRPVSPSVTANVSPLGRLAKALASSMPSSGSSSPAHKSPQEPGRNLLVGNTSPHFPSPLSSPVGLSGRQKKSELAAQGDTSSVRDSGVGAPGSSPGEPAAAAKPVLTSAEGGAPFEEGAAGEPVPSTV